MRSFTTVSALVAVTLSLTSTSSAFWRGECHAMSGTARIDPLMNFGEPGTHAHNVFGGNGFGMSSTAADLEQSSCTSCSIAEDPSAYWHPQLLFQYPNGSYVNVPVEGGMLTYYLLYPNSDNPKVTAFPPGFAMIAGDARRRNFSLPVPDPDKSSWAGNPDWSSQSALEEKAIGFNCLNYAATPEGSLYRHTMPPKDFMDKNCPNGVRFELMFPSCWNGKDVNPPDRKSHMAYPGLVMTGDCPKDFPVRLVSLFYETIYQTNLFAGVDGQFMLSTGDPTGCSYHGDFINGWEESLLQSAVNTCTNPSGLQSDCPLFTIQDASTYGNCKFPMPPAIKADNYAGPMAQLPGNVAIQAGPEPAVMGAQQTGAPSPPPTSPTPVASVAPVSPGSSVASGSQYMPGGIFAASSSGAGNGPAGAAIALAVQTTSSSPPPPPVVTPPPAPTTPLGPGQELMGTSTYTSNGSVYVMVMVEQAVTVTVETTTTVDSVPSPAAGKKRHVGHRGVHGHARRH